MTYKEAIDWLFTQFPAYQNVGVSAYKPDLSNVKKLCEHFDVQFDKLKYIHIAGTNGKGSTSNYLASILQESGLKVGLFTSPHILDFRERIRVNGEVISEQKVISFCQLIQENTFEVSPSFFEITWVLALIHFIDSETDICIIETGLGGRLDATNIITPIISVITNIGLDHVDILGDSVQQIAKEKAGIIKENVPVVIGECSEYLKMVFEDTVNKTGSKVFYAQKFKDFNPFFEILTYSYKNERTVRVVIQLLNQLEYIIAEEQIVNGFKNVSLNTGFFGRLQKISEHPLIIIDAAHNKEGIEVLVKSLNSYKYQDLYIIYGGTKEKDFVNLLNLFPINSKLYLTEFSNSRTLTVDEFKEKSSLNSISADFFLKIDDAFLEIQKSVNKEDMVLVTGSFFLLSDFFNFFLKKSLQK